MIALKRCVIMLCFFVTTSIARGGEPGLLQVVQSKDSSFLLTLSARRVAAVWKVGELKPIATYLVKGLPDGIAFHPTRKTAIISDGSGFVEWEWSKKNSDPRPLFSARANTREAVQDSNNVQRLDISQDGKVLAFRDTLGNIKIQAVPDGKARTLAKVELSSQFIAWIRFIPTGKFLAFNDFGDIHVYDTTLMEEYCVLKGNKNDEVSSLDVSPDGKLLAVGNWGGAARVWNVERKKLVKSIDTGKSEQVVFVCFSPDGTRLCCASSTKIVVYQTKDLKPISKWEAPKGGAAVLISNDNNTIITIGESPHPRYWDVRTGREQRSEKE